MINFQCNLTKQCSNDRCFWKQRDCFGLEPFPVYYDDNDEMPAMQKNADITKQYGKSYFPRWEIKTGTNCLIAYCEDFTKSY